MSAQTHKCFDIKIINDVWVLHIRKWGWNNEIAVPIYFLFVLYFITTKKIPIVPESSICNELFNKQRIYDFLDLSSNSLKSTYIDPFWWNANIRRRTAQSPITLPFGISMTFILCKLSSFLSVFLSAGSLHPFHYLGGSFKWRII